LRCDGPEEIPLTQGLPDLFHPLIRKWFAGRFNEPTAAQAAAWPKIANGEHVLISAPTGSGKTLTAFLFAIDRLVSGMWPADQTQVLYVSPLKALNNDIQKNLTEPIEEIRRVFSEAGQILPNIRAMTRSGDTPETERRAMAGKPPSILITTPESLNILLTSRRGQSMLTELKTVILDEVHAVADNKRGTHLITAVERAAVLSGEFQRIALSATVNPMERIARFVGGRRIIHGGLETVFEPRTVTIVQPKTTKIYEVRVSFVPPDLPLDAGPAAESETKKSTRDKVAENPMWRASAEEMTRTIQHNRSTLVFANSRRGVERMARLINETALEPLVFAHHGSLSREIREVVETRLRDGALKGVVATNSLELGIDIGVVDEVLLLETPPSIASFVQRLGRAGHRVNEVSRGRLFSLHAQDLINAAVMAASLENRDVEPISPPENPLDAAAQVILSMTAVNPMRLDDVFDALRAADPYASFSRKLFDMVIDMLAGKYQGTRLVALRPLLAVDRIDGRAKALPFAVRALYSSGGTIADRGYFGVRTKDGGVKIGELDEEFVWERKIGDVITLGVQSWRIEDIGHSEVIVTSHGSKAVQPPFWTCEERGTSAYFADKRSAFLEQAEHRLDDPTFFEELVSSHHMEDQAATELIRYLKLQKSTSSGRLPHRTQLVVEHILPSSSSQPALTVLHTEWGGKVNRAFGIALQAALSDRIGSHTRVMNDDTQVAIASESYFSAKELLSFVNSDNATNLVQGAIHHTGFFGAEFRESAARSLLILKAGFGRRTPLWLNRKRAKDLREGLAGVSDFPVTIEAYRACLNDHLDLNALRERLVEVESNHTRVREIAVNAPTPFAESVLYKLSNVLVYEDDSIVGTTPAEPSLIDEVTFNESLRPEISPALVRELCDKLIRVYPGYAPSTADELIEWIKERVLIPVDEWRFLLSAMGRDHHVDEFAIVEAVSRRVVALVLPNSASAIIAAENLPRIRAFNAWASCVPVPLETDGTAIDVDIDAVVKKAIAVFKDEVPNLEELLLEQLRFLGPTDVSLLGALFGVSSSDIEHTVSQLASEDAVIVDRITKGATTLEVCHADVFRMLLRMTRARASRSLKVLPAERLPLFIALRQNLILNTGPDTFPTNFKERNDGNMAAHGPTPSLQEVLEPLFGRPASADLWEQDIFPARLPQYRTGDLDLLLTESNLLWLGHLDKSVSFCLSDEKEMFAEGHRLKGKESLLAMFPTPSDRRTIAEISLQRSSDEPPGIVEHLLFDAVEAGCVSCNSFHPARLGRESFAVQRVPRPPRASRWKRDVIDRNLWFRLDAEDRMCDAMEEELVKRDRVKILLDRFGVLFRELIVRETPPFQWPSLFRTLRLMELSGEIVGGRFFEGIRGIQFIAKDALHLLEHEVNPPPVFWMNAKDPASLSGVKVEGLTLPPRIASTHLVFSGTKLVLVSKQGGKNLTFHVEPQDPRLPEYLEVFHVMLTRDRLPVSLMSISKINEKPAWKSPFRPAFESRFDTYSDSNSLNISKRL
jgi:ATP-dependent Lhr-like helicase